MTRAGARRAVLAAALLGTAVLLTACAPPPQRIIVCPGTDGGYRPDAGGAVPVVLTQGGRDVARAQVAVGTAVALLVPDRGTTVLVDGQRRGVVGRDDPGAAAPSDDEVRAAAAADPADVLGFAGFTGAGCPAPASVASTGAG